MRRVHSNIEWQRIDDVGFDEIGEPGTSRSKKILKTEAVQAVADQRLSDEKIHVGPSDYVAWQKDNKVCFLRMEG